MTKRQKFVLSSIILALGFFLVQFIDFSWRYPAIAIFAIFSFALSAWALKEGIGKNATLLTLVMPVFFTAGMQLFYLGLENSGFFSSLPVYFKISIRVLLLTIYMIGAYALFLTSNIYTVAASRTIQLLRAAHAVGFLLTLVAAFLIFNSIYSLRLDFWINGLAVLLVAFPLFLQGLWSIELDQKISGQVLFLSVALTVIVGQIASVLSFWPITVTVSSLVVTTVVYVGLGLGQVMLQQRLFEKTIKEYLLVGLVVFVTMFITARWGG